MTWTDDAKAIPLLDVLSALDIRAMPRGTFGPCPACGEQRRGKEDNRGPLGLGASRVGWRCHRCAASGGGLRAAALRVGSGSVWGWFADRGWTSPPPHHVSRPTPPPKPAPPPEPPPPPVPVADVSLFISRLGGALATWPDARLACATPGLVGHLPEHVPLPAWARWRGQTWRETGHTAIIPMWSPTGEPATVRARAPGPRADGSPKALPPAGYSIPRAMMANPAARAWLRGGSPPPSIAIVEGEPAWVLWSVAAPESAVLGFISGSWSPEWAGRINAAGCPVVVVTDADAAGDRYAGRLLADVRNAIRWPHEKDAIHDRPGAHAAS